MEDRIEREADRASALQAAPCAPAAAPSFVMRVVTLGLSSPWEISWGPDAQLWVSERAGKRIVRVDPASGRRRTVVQIADAHQSSGQDGVLGFALHPQLLRGTGSDYIYVAYTYDADPGTALARRIKIVRYTYAANAEAASSPRVLISGLPGSDDHNAGRLVFGPDAHLYYSIGDQGANQYDNKCVRNRAQDLPSQREVDDGDWSTYRGKILRLALDGSIPSDNPTLRGVRSHIYTYGHRNPQGLVFDGVGRLFSSEQGPKTDDEINRIEAGGNYGWPLVAGYRDEAAYSYGDWSASSPTPCSSLAYTEYEPPASVPRRKESDFDDVRFRPPLTTFYTVDSSYNFMDRSCGANLLLCWPTIAPASLELYEHDACRGIAGWTTSLLVPSLKRGSVYRVVPNADGTAAVGVAAPLFQTNNRYRDLTIGPDNRTFYVATDDQGQTSGPTRGAARTLAHPGAILEFRAQ